MTIPEGKALAYIRVSSISQSDGDGPERQMEAIKRYAVARVISIAETYEDTGVSGTKELADRPGLQNLFRNLEDEDDITHILVESADRLARDLIVGEMIYRDLNRIRPDVKIVACESGTVLTDTDDPTRKLIRQILGAVAEYQKSQTVGRLAAARARKRAETGRCEGRPRMEYHPGVIERIKDLRDSGYSQECIASILNDEMFIHPSGERWNRNRVRRAIKGYLDCDG